jgi:hypothetical protein
MYKKWDAVLLLATVGYIFWIPCAFAEDAQPA